jgi:hypothetical protein
MAPNKYKRLRERLYWPLQDKETHYTLLDGFQVELYGFRFQV